jgi:hypothetical protein
MEIWLVISDLAPSASKMVPFLKAQFHHQTSVGRLVGSCALSFYPSQLLAIIDSLRPFRPGRLGMQRKREKDRARPRSTDWCCCGLYVLLAEAAAREKCFFLSIIFSSHSLACFFGDLDSYSIRHQWPTENGGCRLSGLGRPPRMK